MLIICFAILCCLVGSVLCAYNWSVYWYRYRHRVPAAEIIPYLGGVLFGLGSILLTKHFAFGIIGLFTDFSCLPAYLLLLTSARKKR